MIHSSPNFSVTMPMPDYNHLLSMYNNTEHYGIPDANKEGTFEAAGPRVQVDWTGKGTVAIDNKGKYRIEIKDTANKEITMMKKY